MYNIANDNGSNKVIAVDFVAKAAHKLQKQVCSAIDAPSKVISISRNKTVNNLGWYEVAQCLDITLSMLSRENLTPIEYLHEPLQCEATHSKPTWDSRQAQGDYEPLQPCVDWEAYGKVIA